MAEITAPRPLLESDDRSGFDCGRESINQWFHRHAWANHASGVSRVNVICHGDSGLIVGYVTLSAAQIERAVLAAPPRRHKPAVLPATLFGQLAIHREHHGRGYASSLLLFALRTALRASRDVASFGVVTHPVDESVRAFYAHFGFVDLPFDPLRAMIVRMSDLERSGVAG
ncbi:MAG TPA: GNAT family N-acetyltransferase [Steroidobacteraceae bacterium]|nr:GNAT family N-acetyltransferase [Steroidobacteraceae bacterium]